MFFVKIFLFPLSLIYQTITAGRNMLYRLDIFDRHAIPVASICIGNLTIGGTGKTPLTELIIKLFSRDFNIAMLSRGYGRQTSGFIEATSAADASTIGDEPFQIFSKFKNRIKVFVGEKRWDAVQTILTTHPETNLIVLDDAMQHRAVKAKVNILVSDFNRPFYSDFIMPMGLLRESRLGAKRAHMIVVSKCPELLSDNRKIKIRKQIRQYAKATAPIYFSTISYATPIGSNTDVPFDPYAHVFLFSGLANETPMVNYVKANMNLCGEIAFKDHHHYKSADINYILEKFKKTPSNKVLLTTEKDHVKLQHPELKSLFAEHKLYYLPIEIKLASQEQEFYSYLTQLLAK